MIKLSVLTAINFIMQRGENITIMDAFYKILCVILSVLCVFGLLGAEISAAAEEIEYETFEDDEIPLAVWTDTFENESPVRIHSVAQAVFIILGVAVFALGTAVIRRLAPVIGKK